MKDVPALYHVDWIKTQASTMAEIDGKWVLARPMGLKGRFWRVRFRLAWAVFTGKYDALRWTEPGDLM